MYLTGSKFCQLLKKTSPIFPLATLGCDEAVLILTNFEKAAKFLNLPAFPITPFFPWLPFPLNLASLPTKWHDEFD
jgi:hypothetical protein